MLKPISSINSISSPAIFAGFPANLLNKFDLLSSHRGGGDAWGGGGDGGWRGDPTEPRRRRPGGYGRFHRERGGHTAGDVGGGSLRIALSLVSPAIPQNKIGSLPQIFPLIKIGSLPQIFPLIKSVLSPRSEAQQVHGVHAALPLSFARVSAVRRWAAGAAWEEVAGPGEEGDVARAVERAGWGEKLSRVPHSLEFRPPPTINSIFSQGAAPPGWAGDAGARRAGRGGARGH